MSQTRYNNSYENPAFRDGYQAQSQLLREQDDELEIVSGNGQFTSQIEKELTPSSLL